MLRSAHFDRYFFCRFHFPSEFHNAVQSNNMIAFVLLSVLSTLTMNRFIESDSRWSWMSVVTRAVSLLVLVDNLGWVRLSNTRSQISPFSALRTLSQRMHYSVQRMQSAEMRHDFPIYCRYLSCAAFCIELMPLVIIATHCSHAFPQVLLPSCTSYSNSSVHCCCARHFWSTFVSQHASTHGRSALTFIGVGLHSAWDLAHPCNLFLTSFINACIVTVLSVRFIVQMIFFVRRTTLILLFLGSSFDSNFCIALAHQLKRVTIYRCARHLSTDISWHCPWYLLFRR